MKRDWLRGGRKWCGLACAALLAGAGQGRAEDTDPELRSLIERQGRLLELQGQQIEELKRQLESMRGGQTVETAVPAAPGAPAAPAKPPLNEAAVQKLIGDYLKDKPGAGMPPSVQTGFEWGKGFVIRSAPNPKYVKWDDDCRIPFELRIKGRFQFAYANYKSTDTLNHLTNRPAVQNTNATRFADFSQLLIKRGNIIFEGTAFTPDLRYRANFNGFTRGAGGFQNNEVVQNGPAGATHPSGAPISPIGGGVLVTQPVTLFEMFIAYDYRPCAAEKGCGPDCPEGTFKYSPTYTLMVGKLKPFFGLDEFLGNQNQQFVEYSMADLFFSADDDVRLMAAGFEVKALDNRFFWQGLVTNGSEAFTPNLQMDQYPGFITGMWYDFGGSWNGEKNSWDLFGDTLNDIDYSCNPVLRVGGAANVVPLDRRSLYGDAEQARYFTLSAQPGGTRLINLLNGDAGTPPGSRAVDKFDAYTYNAFVAMKYRGFSVYNEWWLRNLNDFRTTPNGRDLIIYQDTLGPNGASRNALFPRDNGLLDYGMNVAVGYFLIPKKLEVAGRWAWVRGQSGNINGDGTFRTITVPGVPGTVDVVNGAFRNYAEANEYTIGLNYFFKRHLLKWQTDFSIYDGGNPAGGGTSIANFIPGVDGYLIRSQIQFAF